MSYSLREPEWPAVCECKYNEVRDEMDREDCPFHCHLTDDRSEDKIQLPRRRPGIMRNTKSSAA
jgi:hypothetical protein